MTGPVHSVKHTSLANLLRRVSGLRGDPEGTLRIELFEEAGDDRPILERLALIVDPQSAVVRSAQATLSEVRYQVRMGIPVFTELEDGEWLLVHGENEVGTLATRYSGDGSEQDLEHPSDILGQELGFDSGDARRWYWLDSAPSTTDGTAQGPTPTPMQRLRSFFRPDRSDLFAIFAFAVAMGVLLLATPIAVQALVNFVALGGAIPPLIVVTGLLFLGLILAGVLAGFQAWVVELLQRRLFARIVADLAARLPRVTFETFDKRNGPELVNRFFDIITIQKTASTLLLDGLNLVLTVTVGLVLLAFYHPLLLAFDILLIGAICFIVLGPVKKGVQTAIAESYAKHDVAAWLEEIVRHPTLYRSAGARTWLFNRADEVVHRYLDRRATHYRVLLKQIISALTLHVLASTLLLGIGGFLVINGSLSLGQLVAAELVVTMVVGSVSKIGKQLENYYDLMASADKVGYLLDLPTESVGGERPIPPNDGSPAAGASLQLRDVSAGVPGEPSRFTDLSIDVAAGSRLGVRGDEGSGKKLLAEILWGLREPRSGVILVDGRNLADLSTESVRASVCLLDDDGVLRGSVRDNVRMDRIFVGDDDVRRALREVGVLSRIEELPHGLDTELGPEGFPLSPSEVRCLQAARAIVGGPRLIVVTDGFLPADLEERDALLAALLREDAPWTTVLISSSEEVLHRCDEVLDLSPEGPAFTEDSTPLSA